MKKRAQNVLSDWEKIEDARAGWIVEFCLKEEGLAREDFTCFLKITQALSDMEPRSPKLEKPPPWSGHTLPSADWSSPSSRADIQIELDAWWVKNTGLPKDVDEDQPTLYSEFLQALFTPMGPAGWHGISSTAVQKARKAGRAEQQAMKLRLTRLYEEPSRYRSDGPPDKDV